MARLKNKTTKEKLDDAIAKRDNLKEELKETEKIVSELQKQLRDEELALLNEAILTSGYTIKEVIDLLASGQNHTV